MITKLALVVIKIIAHFIIAHYWELIIPVSFQATKKAAWAHSSPNLITRCAGAQ